MSQRSCALLCCALLAQQRCTTGRCVQRSSRSVCSSSHKTQLTSLKKHVFRALNSAWQQPRSTCSAGGGTKDVANSSSAAAMAAHALQISIDTFLQRRGSHLRKARREAAAVCLHLRTAARQCFVLMVLVHNIVHHRQRGRMAACSASCRHT